MEEVAVYLQSFFISALERGKLSASSPGRYTPGKEPRYLLTGGLMGPIPSLDVLEKKNLISNAFEYPYGFVAFCKISGKKKYFIKTVPQFAN